MILTMYHRSTSKEDPIFDYIANNFDKFAKGVGKDVNSDGKAEVAHYLISMNNSYIIQLCKKGDIN